MNNDQRFYQFRAEAGSEPTNAELLIFSVIGDWEDLGEVSARQFAGDLAKLPSSVKRLDIHINSPGGSVSEANGIYSRLADHRSEKIVYVDGLAASAASIIAMVGHRICIRANANMMIHLPSALALGNADDMRTVAAALDSVTESMINIYAKKTRLKRDEIRSLMAAETWFSPQQAIEKGFADELRGVIKTAAIANTRRVIVNGFELELS
jgi:ATP-dependent protease ClpP protease subunit